MWIKRETYNQMNEAINEMGLLNRNWQKSQPVDRDGETLFETILATIKDGYAINIVWNEDEYRVFITARKSGIESVSCTGPFGVNAEHLTTKIKEAKKDCEQERQHRLDMMLEKYVAEEGESK